MNYIIKLNRNENWRRNNFNHLNRMKHMFLNFHTALYRSRDLTDRFKGASVITTNVKKNVENIIEAYRL